MNVTERFLHYVTFDTQSNPDSQSAPTTRKQMRLGEYLAAELSQLGLHNAQMDEHGYVYASIPATHGHEGVPCTALIAHMDTSPSCSGDQVKPAIVHYEGGDIPLGDSGVVIRAQEDPGLAGCVGQDLIVTDGTTLLGADDKAGVAEIVTLAEYIMAHPEVPHGPISICFTPDEEVGRGTDHIDLGKLGAAVGYTVDGGALGEIEYENFNAADARVEFTGFSIHPGSAKDRMKNAALMAMEYAALLPPEETPAHTEGYQGFYHLADMSGDVSRAVLHYVIRDHDREKFEERKALVETLAAKLEKKYGPGSVKAVITDSYYNMREKIEPHMYLIHHARSAFEKAGVTPMEVPIRGGTDGARLSYMGVPCPNLSTGGFNFHGVQEYIPVQSLEKMVEVLVHLVTVRTI